MKDLSLLVGRLLLAALYLVSGFGKWSNLADTATTVAAKGFPVPFAFTILAASAEVLGSLAIIVGIWPRLAALGLVIYTLVTTLVFHAFWGLPDAASAAMQSIHFLKNLGLAGGFLVLMGAGPGRFALMPRGR